MGEIMTSEHIRYDHGPSFMLPSIPRMSLTAGRTSCDSRLIATKKKNNNEHNGLAESSVYKQRAFVDRKRIRTIIGDDPVMPNTVQIRAISRY